MQSGDEAGAEGKTALQPDCPDARDDPDLTPPEIPPKREKALAARRDCSPERAAFTCKEKTRQA